MRRDLLYLVQTDTTAGFLSCSAERLAERKQRSPKKPFLKALSRFSDIHDVGRVPAGHRFLVRRSKKCSFILPNGESFRVIQDRHKLFVEKFGWCFTTSANRHGASFDEAYARKMCDVMVESEERFSAREPSSIWRLYRVGKVKVR
jgi:tRNA A37 threonylcarbamoyladenosine synthetase subunit TsaC/SUA5/YrdC